MVRTGLELAIETDVLMKVGMDGLWWSESWTDYKMYGGGKRV
jgi:hypothetical protein